MGELLSATKNGSVRHLFFRNNARTCLPEIEGAACLPKIFKQEIWGGPAPGKLKYLTAIEDPITCTKLPPGCCQSHSYSHTYPKHFLIMADTYTHTFDTPLYKGAVTLNTKLFINGKWVDPVVKATTDIINPATGKVLTKVAIGSSKDIDLAVAAAHNAYYTTWGLRCPGTTRGKLLNKLADLVEQHFDEFAALEALDAGKALEIVKHIDIPVTIAALRHYAGWADKVTGKVLETNENKVAYTRREPYGVVGAIVPWNVSTMMMAMKLGPALATGNTVVLKPSELTPLTALRLADLINEAGFPPGVVNMVNGYGDPVGEALTLHPGITKVSFTGSVGVGRKVMRAAAESNLKDVTLELGGKCPTIIFEDADLEQAVKWAVHGVYFNNGQSCINGSRIYVQDAIYDDFLARFTQASKEMAAATGDPFTQGMQLGPLISQTQFNRVLKYIEEGKKDGATVHLGGGRHGKEGYFIEPTIFTNTKPNMSIVRDEIFGPVSVIVKFTTEQEVIEAANDTSYGLATHLFSADISRALRVTNMMEAGTVWVNSVIAPDVNVPFGGYKQSGIGREFGEGGIDAYTQVKSVHVNIGARL
ncbi:aldehyde dehydrogenase [Collybia nuda]|uniref:Aldehyde dehydrogenase n=1 Tax=Collybia nuda TaxID=64659 RepID=A0A9P5Y240_9AGAR|nr:aldehyde dehydrogenase [Collybia nuda]